MSGTKDLLFRRLALRADTHSALHFACSPALSTFRRALPLTLEVHNKWWTAMLAKQGAKAMRGITLEQAFGFICGLKPHPRGTNPTLVSHPFSTIYSQHHPFSHIGWLGVIVKMSSVLKHPGKAPREDSEEGASRLNSLPPLHPIVWPRVCLMLPSEMFCHVAA